MGIESPAESPSIWQVESPVLGSLNQTSGLYWLHQTSDGAWKFGQQGVNSVLATGDRKVELVSFEDGRCLALVRSALGYPAYYPVHPVDLERPVKAVLMDLDGTTVRSEEFWIWIIQQTTASLLQNPDFELGSEDIPHVSGHSVSEHLQYCVDRYVPGGTVEEARKLYFEHTHRELRAIIDGGGRQDAFVPAPGVKEFLLELKKRGVKLGLVTSGLHEKAWPEIVSAFRTMGLGAPEEFYDAIITAGFPLRDGQPGTLGELSPKPHPWLYAEVARVGLGLDPADRGRVVGIEDSGAGVCSIRLAGFTTIGLTGGNIEASGTGALCATLCSSFEEVLEFIS